MQNANQTINTRLELIRASEIEPKEIEWLWYPFIPYGKVTLLQGDPGDGKSTFMLTIAALLTRGEPLPFTDTAKPHEPISVIYQTTEDDADDTIVPRFIKANGDRERLLFISEKESPLTFDDGRILSAIRETGARVLILDPLGLCRSATTNCLSERRRGPAHRKQRGGRTKGGQGGKALAHDIFQLAESVIVGYAL